MPLSPIPPSPRYITNVFPSPPFPTHSPLSFICFPTASLFFLHFSFLSPSPSFFSSTVRPPTGFGSVRVPSPQSRARSRRGSPRTERTLVGIIPYGIAGHASKDRESAGHYSAIRLISLHLFLLFVLLLLSSKRCTRALDGENDYSLLTFPRSS